ncbi:PIR Superfamily Protein [Plasmodium ovale curtisi]|uniref:PIR Superfamily Protein n=1 Tax=Plasmodium ovale curtisi TaxID=864141 RepID=A0A1A8XB69_PLAOA|nr:PIR Superfamily Protein [Plasmodium ovale curtisi]
MAQSIITYKTLYELDPSLKSEELFRFYNKFNNICNNEGDTDNGCIKDGIYDNVDATVKDFYKNTASNFKIINDSSSQYFHGMTSDSNKRCIYFKYWFYDEVITKKYNTTKVNNFFDWWTQTNQNVCANCECKLSKIRWDEIHNLKKMYDVILFYGKSDVMLSEKLEKLRDHKYCKYIKDSYITYNIFQSRCSGETNAYCKEINDYIKNNIDDVKLTDLQCNSEIKPIEINQEEQELINGVLSINPLKQTGQDEASSDKQGTLSHTVIGIFGTAFGLFLLLLILYKFTPFGLWISPRIRNYKRMWNKITRKDCESLLDKSVSQQIQSDNRRYNISYNVE